MYIASRSVESVASKTLGGVAQNRTTYCIVELRSHFVIWKLENNLYKYYIVFEYTLDSRTLCNVNYSITLFEYLTLLTLRKHIVNSIEFNTNANAIKVFWNLIFNFQECYKRPSFADTSYKVTELYHFFNLR